MSRVIDETVERNAELVLVSQIGNNVNWCTSTELCVTSSTNISIPIRPAPSKLHDMPRKKHRSLVQKAQTKLIHALGQECIKQKTTQKENIALPLIPIQLAERQILKEKGRDEWMRRYNNEHRKDVRSKAQVENLQLKVKSKEIELSGVQKALKQLDHLVE